MMVWFLAVLAFGQAPSAQEGQTEPFTPGEMAFLYANEQLAFEMGACEAHLDVYFTARLRALEEHNPEPATEPLRAAVATYALRGLENGRNSAARLSRSKEECDHAIGRAFTAAAITNPEAIFP